jgi:HD-GYP domain-containing protein (c-di-GMP phosphodiesterase class II)
MSQNSLDINVFTDHLAKVNESSKVLSSEDIFNDSGVLVVRKNTAIDRKTALQIAKHKLKKSIFMCVSVENILDEKQVYAATMLLLTEHEELKYLHDNSQLNKSLQIGCLYTNQFPLIMQQLTVMKLNLPDLFHKSIAGAWFSVAIASQLELDTTQIKQIYLATLARDIGMMYIKPDLFDDKSLHNDEKWRLIQGHVVIGKLVCDEVKNLPAFVKNAMLEHHERSDGAGYPKAKTSKQLAQAGAIVAISDAIQAIYLHQYKVSGHNIANLQGFLSLNMTTYSHEIYRAVLRLIRVANCEPKSCVGILEILDYITKLNKTNTVYMALCQSLSKFLPELAKDRAPKEEFILKNFIERILKMQACTGVPSEEYSRWMLYVQKEEVQAAYPEMEMTGLMFNELAWQFGQIRNYISSILHLPTTSSDLQAMLADILAPLDSVLAKK